MINNSKKNNENSKKPLALTKKYLINDVINIPKF